MVMQSKISSDSAGRGKVRTQYGALCYRIEQGRPMVLLVTSRRTGRWVTPKGWPCEGLSPERSAAREAWEEAGVIGKVSDRSVGAYRYEKHRKRGAPQPCVVTLFPLRVEQLADDYPEAHQRRRLWFRASTATEVVKEPELAQILRDFDALHSGGSSQGS
jgi:8-oxo-dGTP pyrophosphatase MutT (NUDIX family)